MLNEERKGRYGEFGGQYAAETLMYALEELETAYEEAKNDPTFMQEYYDMLKNYAGRPSLLYFSQRLTDDLGPQVYLKREDLNHTGAHKINNVLGQALLARRMGKKRVIAETGAGQHGVAAATAAALYGMECTVFMGVEDMKRQALNVYRMQLLGASVYGVSSGTGTLKDATSEAMRYWAAHVEDTYYIVGSAVGPHPYPEIVRDFQRVIGDEIRKEMLERVGKLPAAVFACVGGGSNAIGTFYPLVGDKDVRLIGAEAAGLGADTDKHAATMTKGEVGVFHGMKSIFLQDDEGQITPVYSISAGLDYPGIGPEHAYLKEIGRAEYYPITDEEAVCAFEYLSKMDGIIPAIESAHAVALARKMAHEFGKDDCIVITVSGRGDKDAEQIGRYRGQL